MDSLLLAATLLLSLAKAYDCDMEIFFTGFSNQHSKANSNMQKSRAQALDTLWKNENWHTAVNQIEESEELKHADLKLDEWLSPNHSGTAHAASTNTTGLRTDQEKHALLLAHVRDLKSLYLAGWHQRDLKLEDLKNLYAESVAAAKQQPKNLNNASFTIRREIALQKRLQESENPDGTTVLLLLASPLLDRETESIKRDLKGITGGATEFSIETLLFCDSLDVKPRQNHAIIDDSCNGDRDIYNVTELNETSFLVSLLSARLLLKVRNSHVRSIDRLKFKREEDKYGAIKISVPGRPIMLPSVSQIMEALMLENGY
ncbi:hypothetical protein N7523_005851 [Penicillium sp. IBT 18751x]|nr:hypothetical protein N7523_005851 [Penicillium sp. IBT 18751x]